MAERYVLPLKDAPRWERDSGATCAECGQAVVDGERDGATLVCMDCLLRDSPPLERAPLAPHPFAHPEHCAACNGDDPLRSLRRDRPTWRGRW